MNLLNPPSVVDIPVSPTILTSVDDLGEVPHARIVGHLPRIIACALDLKVDVAEGAVPAAVLDTLSRLVEAAHGLADAKGFFFGRGEEACAFRVAVNVVTREKGRVCREGESWVCRHGGKGEEVSKVHFDVRG